MKKLIGLITLLAVLICCASCTDVPELWTDATYQSDTTLGEGQTEFTVEIKAGDKSIELTVKSDEAILGNALFELGIINDPSFFDVANGIKANWSKDNAYWMFTKDGQYMNWGVGDETIENGAHYELVYTK